MDKKLDERLGAIEKEIRKKTQLVKERPNHIQYNNSFSSVTTEKEIDLVKVLNGYIPDFIKVESTQTATLEYEDSKTQRRTYHRGLQANVALRIESENWTKLFITPSASATIYIYTSSAGWQKMKSKKGRPAEEIPDAPDLDNILEEVEEEIPVTDEDARRIPSQYDDDFIPGGL